MKKIEHAFFSFEVPDGFDEHMSSQLIAWARSSKKSIKHSPPFVRLILSEISEINNEERKGDRLSEKFQDYFAGETPKEDIGTINELIVDGYKTLSMALKVKTDFYTLDFLCAAIFLDDTHFISFTAQHHENEEGLLDEWTTNVLKSVEIQGDSAIFSAAIIADEKRFEKVMTNVFEDKDDLDENKEPKKFSPLQIPSNGKEFFKIGDFDFQFLAEETHWEITEFSKELYITLKAKTNNVKKTVIQELLDDYNKEGTVTLSIPAKGIHKNGIPTGEIIFEEEKSNAPLFLHARTEGFDYRLAFSGVISFKEGWVLLSGEMGKDYHDKSFSLQIAKKFSADVLQWKNYQFSSMEEVATANPEDVKLLYIENPSFKKLPDTIFTFKNLEKLSISSRIQNWENEKNAFQEIQEEIGQLKKLTNFHINGAAIKKLPVSISNAIALEQLSVNNCLLEDIPVEVFKLPKLKYLWVSNNQLTKIPEDINLPSIESISLNGNRFTTIPSTLTEQPKLHKIELSDNPLVSLPDNINTIKAIGLAIEDKLRLLDFDYKGADGKGVNSWKDIVFYATNDKDLLPEINTVITENKLSDKAEALRSVVKKAISFKHNGKEDYTELGNHRFGGMPDLPSEIPYPRFGNNTEEGKEDYVYEFIGQINCAAIVHLQDYLPRKGMLYFFLETIHNVYGGGANPGKVIYCKDDSKMASGQRFKFSDEDYYEMFGDCYSAYKVVANKINSVPSFYASYVNTHLFLGEAEILKNDDTFLEDSYTVFEEPFIKKNEYDYAVNAYGFTQHEHPELQASLAKKGNPQDWVTLLVVTSTGDMQWGDAGDLFFVIHKSDLAKCDFSNVFVTLESS